MKNKWLIMMGLLIMLVFTAVMSSTLQQKAKYQKEVVLKIQNEPTVVQLNELRAGLLKNKNIDVVTTSDKYSKLTIVYDSRKINESQIQKEIQKLGFSSVVVKKPVLKYENSGCCSPF